MQISEAPGGHLAENSLAPERPSRPPAEGSTKDPPSNPKPQNRLKPSIANRADRLHQNQCKNGSILSRLATHFATFYALF